MTHVQDALALLHRRSSLGNDLSGLLLVEYDEDVEVSLFLRFADIAAHIVLIKPAIRQDDDEGTVDCLRVASVLQVK